MPISFGTSSFGSGAKEGDVVALIAARKYARAVEILRAQLQKRGANPSLRMQLADVLILAGKKSEAVALLLPLADQYASDGFAAKAVSVLKKIQKVDPGRGDVQARLARLIEEKQKEAVVLPLSRPTGPGPGRDVAEDGGPVLEIGFSMAPISVSAPSTREPDVAAAAPEPPRRPSPAAAPRPDPQPAAPAGGFALLPEAPPPALRTTPPAGVPAARRADPSATLPAVADGRAPLRAPAAPAFPAAEPELPDFGTPERKAEPELSWLESEPEARTAPAAPAEPELLEIGQAIEDGGLDLALAPEPASAAPLLEPEPVLAREPLLEAEPLVEAEPLPTPGPTPSRREAAAEALPIDLDLSPLAPAPPAQHGLGAVDVGIADNDLLYAGDEEEEADLLAAATQGFASDSEPGSELSDGQFADELMSLVDTLFQETPAAAAAAAPPRAGGTQIVVSPLFRDFSVDEMVAVIERLKLLTFERGEVILSEGDPGSSLYTLTSGRVRAFRKDAASGRQAPVGDLKEGAFFGELSVLTGAPRTATVVALTRCELLELDRPSLDEITKRHPHVWDVLREFAAQRSQRR